MGLKAPSWNQRAYSSAVSGIGWKKPPTSVPQYGTPDSPVLSPSGTCASSVPKSLLMSPDQHVAPNRCIPAAPDRQRRKHALVRAVGRLALREALVAQAVVDVVEPRAVARVELRRRRRALATVEPPAADAEAHQIAVGGPPPRAHGRIGEVEVALALTVGRGRPRAGSHALVAGVEEVAARLGLGEQRGVLVEHRILVGDQLEVLVPGLPEQGGRIRPELRLELEVPDAAVPSLRLSVRGQVDQAVTRNASCPGSCAAAGGAPQCRGSGGSTGGSRGPTAAASARARGAPRPRPSPRAGLARSGSTR